MKITKKVIDDVTAKYIEMDRTKKEAAKAKKAYDLAIGPVVDYVNDDLKLQHDKGAELKGHHSVIEFGVQRKVRKLINTIEALRRLETKKKGLGYSLISLNIGDLESNLAPDQYTDLLDEEYGARHVKCTDLNAD